MAWPSLDAPGREAPALLVYRVAVPNLEAVSAFQIQAALDAIMAHFECREDADDVMDALAVISRVHYLPDDDVLSGLVMAGKPFVHLPAFETRSMAWAYFSQPVMSSNRAIMMTPYRKPGSSSSKP